jgi:hypothetical protein
VSARRSGLQKKDRALAGATVHVLAADGTEVATPDHRRRGRFAVRLDPGDYQVVATPWPA